MSETATIANHKEPKKNRGVLPEELVRLAIALMHDYGYEANRKCPLYRGFCFFPVCGPHLSRIFCQGKLAR